MATILSREATIRTAVVEIKALTVSGKQVTQSLFRQLHSKRLIDADLLTVEDEPEAE